MMAVPESIQVAVYLIGGLGACFVAMKAYIDKETLKVAKQYKDDAKEAVERAKEQNDKQIDELRKISEHQEQRIAHLESIIYQMRRPQRLLRDMMVRDNNAEAIKLLDEIDDLMITD